jgi:hypothetical protein
MFSTEEAQKAQSTKAVKDWFQPCSYIKSDHIRLHKQLLTVDQQKALTLLRKFTKTWGIPPIGPQIQLQAIHMPAIPLLPLLQ